MTYGYDLSRYQPPQISHFRQAQTLVAILKVKLQDTFFQLCVVKT